MHYHVIGLNYFSTEDYIKTYRKLDLLFHPDKNNHSQASSVILMINEAKEVLEDVLRYNDVMREQERVLMA